MPGYAPRNFGSTSGAFLDHRWRGVFNFVIFNNSKVYQGLWGVYYQVQ